MKPDLRAPKALLDWHLDAGVTPDVKDRIGYFLKRKKKRRARKAVVTGAALAFLGLVLWAVPYARETSRIATAQATRETFALLDGSQAQLNARTRLFTDFRYNRRVVTLEQGEAFFSVAKDPAHPFVVKTPGGIVRVTGTQFNVRLTGDGRTEVTLIDGKIDFENGGSAPQPLLPDQQVTTGETPKTLTPRSLASTLAWRSGYLVLTGLTLQQAMDRLSAYLGKPIAVSPAVGSLLPAGSFPMGDVPAFFDALQSVLPVKVTPLGDGYRIDPKK